MPLKPKLSMVASGKRRTGIGALSHSHGVRPFG